MSYVTHLESALDSEALPNPDAARDTASNASAIQADQRKSEDAPLPVSEALVIGAANTEAKTGR